MPILNGKEFKVIVMPDLVPMTPVADYFRRVIRTGDLVIEDWSWTKVIHQVIGFTKAGWLRTRRCFAHNTHGQVEISEAKVRSPGKCVVINELKDSPGISQYSGRLEKATGTKINNSNYEIVIEGMQTEKTISTDKESEEFQEVTGPVV